MPDPRGLHPATLSGREALLFEAGIKLGGIFHQFLGTPVSPESAPTLARAIEHAVRLQPYVVAARVAIAVERGGATGEGRLAYRYLTAEMLHVRLTLSDGPLTARVRLSYRPDLRYPLMDVEALGRERPSSAARSARTAGRRRPRSGRSAG